MKDQKVRYLANEKLEFVRRLRFESHLDIDEMDHFFEFELQAFWLVDQLCLLIGQLIWFHFDYKQNQHENNSTVAMSMISKMIYVIHVRIIIYRGSNIKEKRRTLTNVDFFGSNSLKTFKTNSPWLVIPKTPLIGHPPSSTRLGE